MIPACIYQSCQLLAEGPLWHDQVLYWVDIKGHRLHLLETLTGRHREREIPEQMTSISSRSQGGFVVTLKKGFALLEDFDSPLVYLGDVEPELPNNRFNDAKVDPFGNLWAGSMDDDESNPHGSLYRLSADHTWSKIDEDYVITNGPAFSLDGRRLYHTDTLQKVIYRFDLDEKGVRNKQPFIELTEQDGYPDGMTVDSENCLWVCQFGGWCITRFDPDGNRMDKLQLPVSNITSCTFGGEDRDQLYITTAAKGLDQAALQEQPLAGSIFVAEVGSSGPAPYQFAG